MMFDEGHVRDAQNYGFPLPWLKVSEDRSLEMLTLLARWLYTWDNGGGYPVAETRAFLEGREAVGDE